MILVYVTSQLHGSELASVLGNETLAVPATLYGVLMFPLALLAGSTLRRFVVATSTEPADVA